ncbi:hypothetical protein [Vibrio methylphosphonaticus]|nr:hypothetical protein [Vibrio methylphosphonaticus]MCL9776212.1 hypothetical protein [Vibrio methylphosphonaticus]
MHIYKADGRMLAHNMLEALFYMGFDGRSHTISEDFGVNDAQGSNDA